MITITSDEWIADVGAMMCRNVSNKIIVGFERSGKTLTGKIKDMPMELMAKWAGEPEGEMKIQKAVMEAEEVFLRAYFESDIEKKAGSNQ